MVKGSGDVGSTCGHGCAGAFLPGYFQGKRRAEEALASNFPTAGVALRPGFIYGTRQVGGVGIPLGAIGGLLGSLMLAKSAPCLEQNCRSRLRTRCYLP